MSRTLPSASAPASIAAFAIPALILGAMAMGISPIFVRLTDVGPFASAFWRVGGALPLLLAWAVFEARRSGAPLASILKVDGAILAAGLLFAGDLIFWHLAILKTSVANATFLATMAPVWVVLGSGLFIGEKVGRGVLAGLALCLLGAAFLIGMSWSVRPDHLDGDLFGIATSFFFGGYFLAVRVARRRSSAGKITFLSTVITAVVLLAITLATEPRLLPQTVESAASLAGLAFISHAGGQGLLAFALGHLPAAFSALVIFLEAVAAAVAGWLFLGEAVSVAQLVGGAMILAGIGVARPRRPG
ncbi:DMT family transporter [Kaistia sp. 32K]|uniref:DMT family transporter n=1 Tax=Kaistia sp. 32K TaxID=2795690 RepID=UPI001FD05ED8|nr:DMT family transporter [Kaistia sp. 32K]